MKNGLCRVGCGSGLDVLVIRYAERDGSKFDPGRRRLGRKKKSVPEERRSMDLKKKKKKLKKKKELHPSSSDIRFLYRDLISLFGLKNLPRSLLSSVRPYVTPALFYARSNNYFQNASRPLRGY